MLGSEVVKAVTVFALVSALSNFGYGWSECGHHIIAELAFDQLDADLQATVIAVLKHHPRFDEDLALLLRTFRGFETSF